MYEKTTVVKNKSGLHARPAATFVGKAKTFKSAITIKNLNMDPPKQGNAKSMIQIMTLCMVAGTNVAVSAQGEDEVEAVDSLIALIDSGCGEEG